MRIWLYPHLTRLAIVAVLVALGAMAFVDELSSQLWATLVTVGLTIAGWILIVARRRRSLRPGVLWWAFTLERRSTRIPEAMKNPGQMCNSLPGAVRDRVILTPAHHTS